MIIHILTYKKSFVFNNTGNGKSENSFIHSKIEKKKTKHKKHLIVFNTSQMYAPTTVYAVNSEWWCSEFWE